MIAPEVLKKSQDAKKSASFELLSAVTKKFSFVWYLTLDHTIVGCRFLEEPQCLHIEGSERPRRHSRAVDPKVSSTDLKGSATSSQGIRGIIFAMAALKFNILLKVIAVGL